jgi:hypothetical protein
VAPTVQVGVTYTLLVDLGKRNDTNFTASAALLINGTSYLATGVTPTSGNWSTFTATYVGTVADAGKAITIQLQSSGIQANFDNVRLSDSTLGTSIPEPQVAGTFGAGLIALVLFARRKYSLR